MIDQVGEVAALGLRQGSFEPQPVDEARWDELLRAVDEQRLVGVLARGVEAGEVLVDDAQYERLAELQRQAAATDLELERRLVRWCQALDVADVDHRVLKGAALAHLAYDDPSLRSFGDIDLLVRPDQLTAAVGALASAGLRRRSPEVRHGFDARFGKGTTLVDDAGWELDLHRMLATGPYGHLARVGDLFGDAMPLDVGGARLPALPLPDALLVACCNAVLGDAVPRWVPLRDVAVLARSTSARFDEVHDRATRWGIEAVVAGAVTTAWGRLALTDRPPVVDWAMSYRCSARDQRWLALYGEQRSYAQLAFASLQALPSWRDRVAFSAALTFRQEGSPGRPPRERVRRAVGVLTGRAVPR